jgi:hypothetical protein
MRKNHCTLDAETIALPNAVYSSSSISEVFAALEKNNHYSLFISAYTSTDDTYQLRIGNRIRIKVFL